MRVTEVTCPNDCPHMLFEYFGEPVCEKLSNFDMRGHCVRKILCKGYNKYGCSREFPHDCPLINISPIKQYDGEEWHIVGYCTDAISAMITSKRDQEEEP